MRLGSMSSPMRSNTSRLRRHISAASSFQPFLSSRPMNMFS